MPMGRMAMVSEPSGSSCTTGFFFTLVMDSMPTWGWLIGDGRDQIEIGVVMQEG